jgi:hypothetical protein
MALFKNHLSDLDVEILCKDFTIDDAEREALANSAYDAAHDFLSLYDFSSLTCARSPIGLQVELSGQPY